MQLNIQLRQAGVRGKFERLFSANEQVRRYKPTPEAYQEVAQVFNVRPADLWLTSCHAFDVMGRRLPGSTPR